MFCSTVVAITVLSWHPYSHADWFTPHIPTYTSLIEQMSKIRTYLIYLWNKYVPMAVATLHFKQGTGCVSWFRGFVAVLRAKPHFACPRALIRGSGRFGHWSTRKHNAGNAWVRYDIKTLVHKRVRMEQGNGLDWECSPERCVAMIGTMPKFAKYAFNSKTLSKSRSSTTQHAPKAVDFALTFAGFNALLPAVLRAFVVSPAIPVPSTARSATTNISMFRERPTLWTYHSCSCGIRGNYWALCDRRVLCVNCGGPV